MGRDGAARRHWSRTTSATLTSFFSREVIPGLFLKSLIIRSMGTAAGDLNRPRGVSAGPRRPIPAVEVYYTCRHLREQLSGPTMDRRRNHNRRGGRLEHDSLENGRSTSMQPAIRGLAGRGRLRPRPFGQRLPRIVLVVGIAVLGAMPRVGADDEAMIVTPPGFDRPGRAKTATTERAGRLRITVRDRATGRPTPCRINVVGPDGHFYQPAPNPLSPYSLTGQWPKTGKGNREGKAPIRYLGRFFYTTGDVEVAVPAGSVRVEAWKGFEYRPVAKNIEAAVGQTRSVELELERTAPMASIGYHSGDPHLHFPRKTEADDRIILDLLRGRGHPFRLDPGLQRAGRPVHRRDGDHGQRPSSAVWGKPRSSIAATTWIASGQEYRSTTYGHLNLFWRDDLVLKGQKVDANNWPLYGATRPRDQAAGRLRDLRPRRIRPGDLCRLRPEECRRRRVAPVRRLPRDRAGRLVPDPQHRLSFPLRRGERLPRLPQAGRLPDLCPFGEQEPDFAAWLKAAAEGRSFVTSGPLLLLEVDGGAAGRDHPQDRAGAASRARSACERPARSRRSRPCN